MISAARRTGIVELHGFVVEVGQGAPAAQVEGGAAELGVQPGEHLVGVFGAGAPPRSGWTPFDLQQLWVAASGMRTARASNSLEKLWKTPTTRKSRVFILLGGVVRPGSPSRRA